MNQKTLFKFNKAFLDSLNLQNNSQQEFDTFLQNAVKNYLLNKNSFVFSNDEPAKADLKTDIENAYLYLSNYLLPKYNDIRVLEEITRTTETIFDKGQEDTQNYYFEPKVNNTQNKVNNNGTIAESYQDTTTNTETTKGESKEIIDFYNKAYEYIEFTFMDFVNIIV